MKHLDYVMDILVFAFLLSVMAFGAATMLWLAWRLQSGSCIG
jgi:hypothetical protein